MTATPSGWQTLELRTRRSLFVRKDELKNDSARMLVMACAVAYLVFKLFLGLATGSGGEFALTVGGGFLIACAFILVGRRMRLRVDPQAIERVGGLPAKHVDRADVIGVVRVPIESFRMQEGFVDVLVNRDGRCLLRMRDRMWENGDLDRAWAHASLGIQHVPQAMNYKQLEDWIPGSTKFWERRPSVFGWIVAVVLIFVSVVITLNIGGTAP